MRHSTNDIGKGNAAAIQKALGQTWGPGAFSAVGTMKNVGGRGDA